MTTMFDIFYNNTFWQLFRSYFSVLKFIETVEFNRFNTPIIEFNRFNVTQL